MGFFAKIRAALAQFMEGRCGPDQLSRFTVWTGLILLLVSMFTGGLLSGVLSLAAFVLYIWSLVRMFSRNRTKRFMENQKYLEMSGKARTEAAQSVRRLKNMKQYKYLRCPQCRARLRLPRGVGNVTARCGKCGHSFDAKA